MIHYESIQAFCPKGRNNQCNVFSITVNTCFFYQKHEKHDAKINIFVSVYNQCRNKIEQK